MNFITKKELENKDIVSKFTIDNNTLIIPENYEYKSTFDVGDIVTDKHNTNKLGIVSFSDEDEITVNWDDNNESTESLSNLIIIPPTVGLKLLKNENIIKLWESLSNGKNDSFDLKCIYLDDKIINEVPFIKFIKNTHALVDKKFKRTFTLYKKFGNLKIFRTNIYTINDNEIKLDKNRYVYYLVEENVVYYLGMDFKENDLNIYLFNR